MSASAIRQEQSLERWLRPLLPPGDEPLGQEDLLRLVCGLGVAREAWSPFVHHDPAVHQAVCLHKESALELWLVCWLDGQSTGVHRHEGRSGCVYVAEGCLLEEVFEDGPANRAFTRSYRRRTGVLLHGQPGAHDAPRWAPPRDLTARVRALARTRELKGTAARLPRR